MVGPVLNTGPTQSSRYALPNYAPIAAGLAQLGQGLGRGIMAAGQREREATLSELVGAGLDHREFVSRAAAAGIPMPMIA